VAKKPVPKASSEKPASPVAKTPASKAASAKATPGKPAAKAPVAKAPATKAPSAKAPAAKAPAAKAPVPAKIVKETLKRAPAAKKGSAATVAAAPVEKAPPAAKVVPPAAAPAPVPTPLAKAAPAPAPVAATPAPVAPSAAPASGGPAAPAHETNGTVAVPAAPKAPSKRKKEADAVAEAAAALAATEAAKPPEPIPSDMPLRRADGTITLAHSPDADDAFMFYALAAGKVDTEDRKYEHILSDIQSLNVAAQKGTYDVTAISFHAYPYVRSRYALLTCGASFGDGYGPILVAKAPIRPNEVDGLTVALPGELTTAALVTRLWFGRAKIKAIQVPFDKVGDAVKSGLVRAGVIIHEGQLTYREQGLVKVVDFGQWWSERTEGLPLPLGGNGVRRDIPKALVSKIALDLKRSIAFALGHREEALAHAMKYGRNLSKDKADKFVGMYVNDLTLDYGERGRQAVGHLLDQALAAGLLKEKCVPEFVG